MLSQSQHQLLQDGQGGNNDSYTKRILVYHHILVVLTYVGMGSVIKYMRKELIEEKGGVNSHHTVVTDHLAALQYGKIVIFQRPFKPQQRSKGIVVFVIQVVHLPLLIDFTIVVWVFVDPALRHHGGLAMPLELPAVAEFTNRAVQEVMEGGRLSRLLRETKWTMKEAIAKKTNSVQLFRVLL